MKPGTGLRWMMRESRGARGRMVYFAACLAVGVAAVVGTAALADRIEASLRERSREILGADLAVEARRPPPATFDAALAEIGVRRRTDLLESTAMVAAPGRDDEPARSRLAIVTAVDGPWPLHGEIVTEPPGGLAAHLADDSVVVAAGLLAELGVAPGDDLLVGGGRFRIAAATRSAPRRFGLHSLLGPPIYVTRAGFRRTGLLLFGTRVEHRVMLALPGNPDRRGIKEVVERLRQVPGSEYLDFDPHFDVGPGRRGSSRRVEGFAGLVALLSLVVGGIGVAQIVRVWTAERTPSIAVLRCIGLRSGEILVLSLGHVGLLALAGSAIGAAVGYALPALAHSLAPDLVPPSPGRIVPVAAAARGLLLGPGLALAFALPPLTAIWRVSPARVLRADAEPLPPNRAVAATAVLALTGGVLAAAWFQAGALVPALWFTGGIAGLVLLLALGARLLVLAARVLPRHRLPAWLAHGVAALARPGAGTVGAVVALGLGTMVVVATWLTATRLEEGLRSRIPADAPDFFVSDIRPDQWPEVAAMLREGGAQAVERVPVVMARIAAIDGRSVEELLRGTEREDRSRWALRREQRLTWREELNPGNEVVEGVFWGDPDRPEVSLEERFARRLEVGVGSTITFDVGGQLRPLLVTSLRSVDWESLRLNFFLVAEPGALGPEPEVYAASARVDPDAAPPLQDRLAAAFGNVTVIRTGPILEKVLDLLSRLVVAIGVLGSFTVVAGLAILAGAASAAGLRRSKEVALLKTLGVTRAGVTALFATEYGLLGGVAGAVGAGGALLLAHGFLAFLAEVGVALPLLAVPVAALGAALLTAVCGLAASARALRTRPLASLR